MLQSFNARQLIQDIFPNKNESSDGLGGVLCSNVRICLVCLLNDVIFKSIYNKVSIEPFLPIRLLFYKLLFYRLLFYRLQTTDSVLPISKSWGAFPSYSFWLQNQTKLFYEVDDLWALNTFSPFSFLLHKLLEVCY